MSEFYLLDEWIEETTPKLATASYKIDPDSYQVLKGVLETTLYTSTKNADYGELGEKLCEHPEATADDLAGIGYAASQIPERHQLAEQIFAKALARFPENEYIFRMKGSGHT